MAKDSLLAKLFGGAVPERPLYFDPDGANEDLLERLQRLYERERSRREFWEGKSLDGPVELTEILPRDKKKLKWLQLELKEARARMASSKGGRKPKGSVEILLAVDLLVSSNPSATARELWKMIGDLDPFAKYDIGIQLILDGEKLVLIDLRPRLEPEDANEDWVELSRPRTIAFRAFENYVRKAKERHEKCK